MKSQVVKQSPSIMHAGSPFEHRVARAISACTRCRSRKSKCDGKLPACTACEKAKVECIGFDAISKKNVSRSYIHELESEVLELRKMLGLPMDGEFVPLAGAGAASGSRQPAFGRSESGGIKSEGGFDDDAVRTGNRNAIGNGTSNRSSPQMPHDHQSSIGTSSRNVYDNGGGFGSGNGNTNGNGIRPSSSSGNSRDPYHYGDQNGGGYQDSPRSRSSDNRRIVDGVVSNMTFAAVESSTDFHQRQVGHFMGSSSGVSLARMVLDAVLREGASGGPPVPERKSSMDPAMSRPLSPTMGHSPREGSTSTTYPTSHQRGNGYSSSSGNGGRHGHSPSSPNPSYFRSAKPVNIPALPPPAAVDRLVQVYVDFVQVMLPILHMPTFQLQLERVRDKSPDVTESDIFFVLMVLALSTMALSRSLDPTAELRMSSEAFYIEASKHMEDIFEDNTYAGLQAILLCCYYSLLNPARGSVWHLVGLASRVCVDYGFHHETAQQLSLSPLEIDMRRRLFAAVYNLDRLLCHALGRPPSIPDDFIDVPPFSNLPDSAITDRGLLPSEPDPYKLVALNFIPLRELQSDISSRLYKVRSTESPPEEWFLSMFEKLKTWLANSPEPRGSASTEGYAISFHNTVLLLFRPSPACPRPSRDALATCLSSSSYIIRIFRSMQRKNKINWWWLSCHYVFMAGITYLYGLWNMNLLGDSSVTPSLMEAHLDIQACSRSLEALAVNVPSAHACQSTFEMLSSAILRRLSGEQAFDHGSDTSNSGRGDGLGVPISGEPTSIGKAGVHAESAMRHSFQSRGVPSPLPKMDLPTELRLLDNLFLNPMVPHPKASDSTTCRDAYTGMPSCSSNLPENNVSKASPTYYPPTPSSYSYLPTNANPNALTPGADTNGLHALAVAGLAGMAEGDLAAHGFDFLSFLAADDGGQGANAVWEQTEAYRQDMPML